MQGLAAFKDHAHIHVQRGLPSLGNRQPSKHDEQSGNRGGVCRMLSWSLKHLVHPATNLRTGFLTEIGDLSRLQWRTRDEINRRVLKRLRFVISHACENFRFYHDMLKAAGLRPRDIDSFEEFRRIPTVNKCMMARRLKQEGVLRSSVEPSNTC